MLNMEKFWQLARLGNLCRTCNREVSHVLVLRVCLLGRQNKQSLSTVCYAGGLAWHFWGVEDVQE